MKEASPTKGAGSDATIGRVLSLAGWSRPMISLVGSVRTSSSNADNIDSFATQSSVNSVTVLYTAAFTQSEGDLAVPEAGGSRAEGRPSGKSGAARSDRRETSSCELSWLSVVVFEPVWSAVVVLILGGRFSYE